MCSNFECLSTWCVCLLFLRKTKRLKTRQTFIGQVIGSSDARNFFLSSFICWGVTAESAQFVFVCFHILTSPDGVGLLDDVLTGIADDDRLPSATSPCDSVSTVTVVSSSGGLSCVMRVCRRSRAFLAAALPTVTMEMAGEMEEEGGAVEVDGTAGEDWKREKKRDICYSDI